MIDLPIPIGYILGGLAVVLLAMGVLRKSKSKGGSSSGLPPFIKQSKWFAPRDIINLKTVASFLDYTKEVGCNSILLKVGQWPLMGFNNGQYYQGGISGKFYLQTYAAAPFCQN